MSLIGCPECGNKVSSYAASCPVCGYPVEQIEDSNKCLINGQLYDLSEVLPIAQEEECPQNYRKGWDCIKEATGLGSADAMSLYDKIREEKKIPPEYVRIKERSSKNVPKCPTCSSTNLTKITAGARAIDGLFFGRLSVEGRAQWRCNKCGYLW